MRDESRGGQRLGMVCVAASAMLFASKGLFGKALYQRGVGFELLVTVRAVLAMPLFAWMAFRKDAKTPALATDEESRPLPIVPPRARPRARAWVGAVVAGIFCYYVGALLDFWALTLIDASVERVLLFSYPAIVVLITALSTNRAPQRKIVLAVLATWVGIFFAMGGVDLAALRANAFGAGLVLVAAFTTAIYFLIGERFTRELGSTRFAAVGMSSAAVVLAVQYAIRHPLGDLASLDAHDWSLLVILGIACMFVPGLLQAEGMRRVGAQRAAIGSTIGPPTTILLAASFLGERLNLWQLFGTAIIVVAVLVLSLGKTSEG